MKIYFHTNTKITQNNIIKNDEYSSCDEYLNYLDSNYNILNTDNWIELNNYDLSDFNKLIIKLDDKDLGIDNLINIDFATIELYNLIPSKKFTYWEIKKLDVSNKKLITITLELNYLSTFSLKDLGADKVKWNIQKTHIIEQESFSDLDKLILKKESIFRQEQPISSDQQTIELNENGKIGSLWIDLIDEHFNFTKWIVAIAKADFIAPSSSTKYALSNDKPTTLDNNSYLERSINIIILPLADNIKVKDMDGNIQIVNGLESYYNAQSRNEILSAIVLDYPPTSILNIIDDNTILHLEYLKFHKENDLWFLTLPYYSAGGVKRDFDIRDYEFWFNWNTATDEWLVTENLWFMDQEIILNFSPYTNFKIGIYTETSGGKWPYKLNDVSTIPNIKNKKLFTRIFSAAENTFSLIDSPIDSYLSSESNEPLPNSNGYIQGQRMHKINRSFLAPLANDAWENYTANKMLNGASDFLIPGLGIAAAALVPGGLATAALVGSGLSATKTIANRQNIKHTADTPSNSATDLLTDATIRFDTKSVSKITYSEQDKKTIAFEFHKKGYFYFHRPKLADDLIQSKKRFNYLQISQFETNNIFSKSIIRNKIILDQILKILINGIHFWNFDNDWPINLKNYIFDFNQKNPTKGYNPITIKDFLSDDKLSKKEIEILASETKERIDKIVISKQELKKLKKQDKLIKKIKDTY